MRKSEQPPRSEPRRAMQVEEDARPARAPLHGEPLAQHARGTARTWPRRIVASHTSATPAVIHCPRCPSAGSCARDRPWGPPARAPSRSRRSGARRAGAPSVDDEHLELACRFAVEPPRLREYEVDLVVEGEERAGEARKHEEAGEEDARLAMHVQQAGTQGQAPLSSRPRWCPSSPPPNARERGSRT
jgi:hypothetical protein